MSGVGALVPLLILVTCVAVLAFLGYHVSVWSNELADRGKKKLEKKNMSFTPDGGLRVGVQDMSDEKYADKTQNLLVNTWNNASFPAYKSRLGWNSSQADKKKSSPSLSPRPGASRENSNSARPVSTSNSPNNPALRPPEHRSSAKRASSPLPGGWD